MLYSPALFANANVEYESGRGPDNKLLGLSVEDSSEATVEGTRIEEHNTVSSGIEFRIGGLLRKGRALRPYPHKPNLAHQMEYLKHVSCYAITI
jgi:hypothetical protein